MNTKTVSENDIYHAYGISTSDDDENENINNIESRPSVIMNKKFHTTNSDTNSDSNSDSNSDGNDYIALTRRRPSFIKKNLGLFSSRIRILPEHIKGNFINKNDNNTYFYIMKSTMVGAILFFINCIGLEKKPVV